MCYRRAVPHQDVTEPPPAGRLSDRADALRERYRSASKAEKSRLLDEFVQDTGYHRKHAVRLLRRGFHGPRRRLYDDSDAAALVAAWELAGRVGSRRLRALLPVLVASLTRQGHLPDNLLLRGRLCGMSAATIDRILAPLRARTEVAALEARLKAMSGFLEGITARIAGAGLTPSERNRLVARLSEAVQAGIGAPPARPGAPGKPDDD